ncbi:MAG: NifU family protein [Chitinophagales bacterium]|jgi:Fe-S cluster biogenesis protein NfuA|nr:NifU family protein [Chitinophagales bacterium]
MNTQANSIQIYIEQTPNPDSIKFITDRMMLPEMTFESKRNENQDQSPLAKSLYEKFDWINGILISQNFISITKNNTIDWYEYFEPIKNFLKMYLVNELEIVTKGFLDTHTSASPYDLDTIEGKLQDIIDKYIKPAVERDGGSVAFQSFENGVVRLKMLGSCSGCPSSSVTLKSGIESLLRRMVPEVLEVIEA